MFEDLRRAFREAVSNFKDELGREDVPEVMDQLLRSMVQEMTDSKAYLYKLDADVEATEKRLKRHEAEAKTARRRHEMAAKINDDFQAKLREIGSWRAAAAIEFSRQRNRVLGMI